MGSTSDFGEGDRAGVSVELFDGVARSLEGGVGLRRDASVRRSTTPGERRIAEYVIPMEMRQQHPLDRGQRNPRRKELTDDAITGINDTAAPSANARSRPGDADAGSGHANPYRARRPPARCESATAPITSTDLRDSSNRPNLDFGFERAPVFRQSCQSRSWAQRPGS